MAGYLDEIEESDGAIRTWQTPNRQRWWGLVAALVPAGILIHATRNINKIVWPEVWVAGAFLVGAMLVALYTVRFSINLRSGTYLSKKGFLPSFFWGEEGKCVSSFECVALRKDTMIDANRHDGDPDADSFDQYRVLLVWKDPAREAFLIDTEPSDYAQSLMKVDFRAMAMMKAKEIADSVGLTILDQTEIRAAVSMESSATETIHPSS